MIPVITFSSTWSFALVNPGYATAIVIAEIASIAFIAWLIHKAPKHALKIRLSVLFVVLGLAVAVNAGMFLPNPSLMDVLRSYHEQTQQSQLQHEGENK